MQGLWRARYEVEEEGTAVEVLEADRKGQGMSEEDRKNWTMPKQLWYYLTISAPARSGQDHSVNGRQAEERGKVKMKTISEIKGRICRGWISSNTRNSETDSQDRLQRRVCRKLIEQSYKKEAALEAENIAYRTDESL